MVCCVTMMDYLREAYNRHLTSDKVFIFTDSLLNLQRIQRGKGRCKPFEERRFCSRLIVRNYLNDVQHSRLSEVLFPGSGD